jgi:hypothetical protein
MRRAAAGLSDRVVTHSIDAFDFTAADFAARAGASAFAGRGQARSPAGQRCRRVQVARPRIDVRPTTPVVRIGGACYEGVVSCATPRDRAHFEAIAVAEAASEEERIARALATPPGERMTRGIELGVELPWTPAVLAEVDARADGQIELARRRVALGLGSSVGR